MLAERNTGTQTVVHPRRGKLHSNKKEAVNTPKCGRITDIKYKGPTLHAAVPMTFEKK